MTLYVGAPSDPVRVRTDDGFHGLLMPIHLGQPDLERRIAGWLGMDRDDLYVDEDGWIPITTVEDTTIWVHLLANGEEIDFLCREIDHHVQMFGPLFDAVHR